MLPWLQQACPNAWAHLAVEIRAKAVTRPHLTDALVNTIKDSELVINPLIVASIVSAMWSSILASTSNRFIIKEWILNMLKGAMQDHEAIFNCDKSDDIVSSFFAYIATLERGSFFPSNALDTWLTTPMSAPPHPHVGLAIFDMVHRVWSNHGKNRAWTIQTWAIYLYQEWIKCVAAINRRSMCPIKSHIYRHYS